MLGVQEKQIEDILIEEGKITVAQLKEALRIGNTLGKPIIEIMLDLAIIRERDVVFAEAKIQNVDYLDLRGYEIEDKSVLDVIPVDIALKYNCIPLKIEENTLWVAMNDAEDLFMLDDLVMLSKLSIKPVLSYGEDIKKLIETVYVSEAKLFMSKAPTDLQAEIQNELVKQGIPIEIKPVELDTQQIKKFIDENNYSNSPIYKSKLGTLLLNSGAITEKQLEHALEIQKKQGGKIGKILLEENWLEKEVLNKILGIQLNIPHVNVSETEIPSEIVRLVTEKVARGHKLIPIEKNGDILKVAMADPMDVFALDDLRLLTGLEIVPLIADEDAIIKRLGDYFKQKVEKSEEPRPIANVKKQEDSVIEVKHQIDQDTDFDEEMKRVNQEIEVEINAEETEENLNDISEVSNAPIVKMVNIIFQKAVIKKASDIHIEPYADCLVVRFRVDGQLVEAMKHDKKILSPLVARIKIISALNIAEKRIPQDGRVTISVLKKNYDLRVSVIPTVNGEKVVIRIADKEAFEVSKKDLGLFEDDLKKFDDILKHPHGIVLVTGPTGSGKSTTLYTALRELSKPNVNILTVEDPVECAIRGINQIQVNTKAGLTFGTALRSFLRQDPDIIMVGEIRDSETAEIATRAAITGHLVLSTLHTNDAASSITRMIDMGIEPFIISSSIVGVIAQRLVRRLCPVCKVEHEIDENDRLILDIEENTSPIFKPKGCNICNHSGYKGRIAIYEIMNITRRHREMIAKNISSDELKELSISLGMKTLKDNCKRLVKAGTTSIDEMLKVTYSKD